jgi:Trp operon repressor
MDALAAAAAAQQNGYDMPDVGAPIPEAPAAAAVPALAAAVLHPSFRTSVEKRYAIVALHKDHQSRRTIARKLGVSRTTVAH